jgi:hypothetical protein
MGLLALSVGRHDLLVYLAATAVAGAGYSLLFVGGLQLINATVDLHHRGGVLSALYLIGYLSMGVVALVLGIVATARGLALALAVDRICECRSLPRQQARRDWTHEDCLARMV